MSQERQRAKRKSRPFDRLGRKLRRYNVPFQLLANSFGAVTGALFLFSALLSAITMKITLRLDYFSLATPSDVLMNGVKALGFATLLYAVSFTMVYGRAWWGRKKELRRIQSVRRLKGSPARHYLTSLKAERDEAYRQNVAVATILLPAIMLMAGLLNAQTSGLVYVSGADLPESCSYQKARWVGSQAAVIECTDGVRVVRDGEDVVFFRPNRECGFRLPRCRTVGLEELRRASASKAP